MSISFACKQIDFSDLVMCSFSLNKTEYKLFLYLLKQDESLCVSTIGNKISKDRTTIQKAIKKLVKQGLVEKHQVNLSQGGYTFVYKIKNKEHIRNIMLTLIDSWYKKVIDKVQNW